MPHPHADVPSCLRRTSYTKFLCDRSGLPVKRYAPLASYSAIEASIEVLLDQVLVAPPNGGTVAALPTS